MKIGVEDYKGKILLAKWYRAKEMEGQSRVCLAHTDRIINTYFLPVFADVDCRTITSQHIDKIIRKMRERLSYKTKIKILASLRQFCDWLRDQGIITKVPDRLDIVLLVQKETAGKVPQQIHCTFKMTRKYTHIN
ncbi:MAG: hypothetical protein ACLP29_04995 [Dissulfurispiraceae bacterium]